MNVILGTNLALDTPTLPVDGSQQINLLPTVTVRVFEGSGVTAMFSVESSDGRNDVPGAVQATIPVTLDNGFAAGRWYNAWATWETGSPIVHHAHHLAAFRVSVP